MVAWGKGGKGGKGNAPAVQYSAAIVARVAHNLMDAISLPCWSALFAVGGSLLAAMFAC